RPARDRALQRKTEYIRLTKGLHPLDRHGGAFAAADAEGGDAALGVAGLECVEEGDEDAGAAGANGVAEGAGAAVDVELVVGNVEIFHGGHGHDGEGLVHFPKVDVAVPAERVDQA